MQAWFVTSGSLILAGPFRTWSEASDANDLLSDAGKIEMLDIN